MRVSSLVVVSLALIMVLLGCDRGDLVNHGSDNQLSESAASVIGGVINDSMASAGGDYAETFTIPRAKPTWSARLLNWVSLMPLAHALTATCTGGSMSPSTYNMPSTRDYDWTPTVCSLVFQNTVSTSVSFTGAYHFNYGTGCTATASSGDFMLSTQANGCVVTRTTPSSGVVRSLRSAKGVVFSVGHNTTDPQGFDSTITTANTGAAITCTADHCASRSIVIGGSHITASYAPGGNTLKLWDQTVSTDSDAPIVVTGTGTSKVVSSGTLIVQDNTNQVVGHTTIAVPLTYTEAHCCHPTAGTLKTTFVGGPNNGLSESIVFSKDCGEAVAYQPNGVYFPITLNHCM
jgi:hypothetical protein